MTYKLLLICWSYVLLLFLLIILVSLLVVGCGFLEAQTNNVLQDITGWDLSACINTGCGRSTCLELLLDNASMFRGGSSSILTAFGD